MRKASLTALLPFLVPTHLVAAEPSTKLYVSARLLGAFEQASALNTSLRPGIGSFVKGRETASYPSGSFAVGENLGHHWRVEAEYVIPRKSEFTSGSSIFPTSLNHFYNNKQRATVNVYRDIGLFKNTSLYLMAGAGVSIVKSTGWQGNESQQFMSNTNTNIMYTAGVGFTQHFGDRHAIDLGYRFADLGKVHTGMNNFTNVRGLQDEQLKGHIYSHEILLGYRFNI